MRKLLFVLFIFMIAFSACQPEKKQANSSDFIRIENGQFIRNGEPYYYVGANFWYGAILGSEGEGGNRERLHKELDKLDMYAILYLNNSWEWSGGYSMY